MKTPTIRRANDADADSLSRIGRESFAKAYSPHNPAEDMAVHLDSHFSSRSILDEMGRDDRFYLIAEIDESPAGLCKLLIDSKTGALPDRHPLEIRQLYVRPSFQRFGLGRKLVDAATAEASARGLDGVWLSVWDRADWARRFYTSCGFRTVGSTDFRLGSSEQTDLVMWLPGREVA